MAITGQEGEMEDMTILSRLVEAIIKDMEDHDVSLSPESLDALSIACETLEREADPQHKRGVHSMHGI